MNPNNYVTLEQAKKMKELGYPQDNTDCIWTIRMGIPVLYARVELNWRDGNNKPAIDDGHGDPIAWFDEWYAAPNAQEIELDDTKFGGKGDLIIIEHVPNSHTSKEKDFGQSHHAQTRADAWIWEREK
jgi:hypothetical protein